MGLQARYGDGRGRDMPIAGGGFVGWAVGAAMTGLRPIVEIGFEDFLTACMDPIVNQAAKLRYMLGGQVSVPVMLYTFGGGGLQAGPQHSQSFAAWFAHVPGLKVVMPSSASDVLGLAKAAIRDGNFVLCLLSKSLIPTTEEVPDEDDDFIIPLGQAVIKRAGEAVTIVSMGAMVNMALQAAEKLAVDGIEAEVIDLRTISPLDHDTIMASLRRTGRLVVVHEAMAPCGVGAEIIANVYETAPEIMKAAPVRVTPPFAPSPFTPALEKEYRPSPESIESAVLNLLERDQ